MQIFIQHPATLQYLHADSRWTPDLNDALSFRTVLDAVDHGVDSLKQPFLIVFKSDGVKDITLYTYATGVSPQHPLRK